MNHKLVTRSYLAFYPTVNPRIYKYEAASIFFVVCANSPDKMGKVSSFLFIAFLVAGGCSFPLEDTPKETNNSPHALLGQHKIRLSEDKPQESTSEVNRPKRDESQQSHPSQPKSEKSGQTENQGPTPKPVHHYRDGPIIQRRSADSSTDESSRTDDQQDSKTHNRQRRNADEENVNKAERPSLQSSNPSLLARNPVYLPDSKSTGRISTSPVPDLIPSSTSNLRSSPQEGVQHHPSEATNGKVNTPPAQVNSDNLRERKTRGLSNNPTQASTSRPVGLHVGQENQAGKSEYSSYNQEQKDEFKNQPHVLVAHPSEVSGTQNRKVRDVNDNQPHLLASNPKSSLNENASRSTAAVYSSSTTENTKLVSSYTH
ncbi:uncharacterized protein isoform X2 [Leptinotarsa decemlineata]|uniref:uncharacterized protein isoform X2 n=1 Tax=Leptinotarsa decemlineata TaxID=7539 RepID=UPI003D3044EF